MLLAPLLLSFLLLPELDVIEAFETADVAKLNELWSERSPHRSRDRRRLRRLAVDPRHVATWDFGENTICLDLREPGGTLLEQYEIELRDGQLWAVKPVVTTPLPRARELVHRGRDLLSDGHLAEATAAFSAAVDLTTHVPTRADAVHGLGHVAFARGDVEQAGRHFHHSLDLARAVNDRWSIARALEGLAAVDRFTGNFDRAESRLVEALRHFDAAGDRVWVAYTLGAHGNVRAARGDYHGARRLYRQSLAFAEETGHETAIIHATISLGVNARFLGHHRQSLALLTRGLEMSEADGDLLGIAYANANLGTTLAAMGQLPEAVQAFHRGLELKERLGRAEPIILELAHLGDMYRRLGNHDQAAAQFERALALSRQSGFKAEIARGLHNLGQLKRDRGDARGAIPLYEKALAIDREVGNRAGIARDLHNIGQAQLAAGDRAAARRAFEQSLAIAEEIDARESMTMSLAMLSQLGGDAIETARRALTIAEDLGLPEHLWYAHLALGRAYRRAGRLADARAELERAVAIVEELRRGVPGEEEAQQQAFARMVEPYHELIALLVQQGDAAGAFAYAERAKARVLLDVLHNGRPDIGSVLTEAERAREAELTARIAELNRAGATRQLRQARLDYDTFLTSIYAAHPQLRRERGEVGVVQASGLPSTFLEFVVTRDRTFLFTSTGVETIEITERQLAAEVTRLRNLIASRDLLYEPAARALYDRLLRKVAPQLRGKQTICIVPDGPLWELPFHALQPASGEFLIDRHAIHYAPSLSALREMSSRARATRAERLLAFGNPLLPGKRASVHRDTPLAPLPHTETEIRAIASLYGANNSRLRLRAEAREELVKAEAGSFDVLHLATHGILDDQNALYSRLVFSPPAAAGEDGLLEAREIMRLDLRARLAVLSACETARGRVSSGEGVIGMAWALFVAGVPSTVVSQWKVDSTSTTELMIDFHRHLRAGRTNAEALRRAALKTREAYRHPFYWAPFVVVGAR